MTRPGEDSLGDLALDHDHHLRRLAGSFEEVPDDRVRCEVRQVADDAVRLARRDDLIHFHEAGVAMRDRQVRDAVEAAVEMGNQPVFDFERNHRDGRLHEIFRELSRAGADLDEHATHRRANRARDIEKDPGIPEKVLPQLFARLRTARTHLNHRNSWYGCGLG